MTTLVTKLLKNLRERIARSFVRLLLFVILCSLLTSLILLSKKASVEQLQEGDVALKSIYAPMDFNYEGPLDEERIKLAREQALKTVFDVFLSQHLSLDSKIFNVLPEYLKLKAGVVKEIYAAVYKSANFISADEKMRLSESKAEKISVLEPTDNSTKEIAVSTLKSVPEAKAEIEQRINNEFKNKKDSLKILGLISKSIKPNLVFDADRTSKNKVAAQAAVAPIHKQLSVKKNELIIDQGQVVTRPYLDKLQALYASSPKKELISFYVGTAILMLVFIAVIALFMKVYYPKVYYSNKDLGLLSVFFLLAVVLAKIVEFSPFPLNNFLVPVASFSMAYMMLTGNTAISFIFAAALSVVMGVTFSNNIGLLIIFFIGSIVGVTSVRKVRRRSQILQAGILVGIVQFISILGWGLYSNLDYYLILPQAISWGIGNGITCAAILMIFLPILESLFGYVTNITLLEMSDFNQPLLKEMVLKATGTYHHSLLVGNLCEAAAESIGANSLLARVGAYFHDIGKIEKAEYFSENQHDEGNKHDRLNPSMSKLVIVSHVKEGLDLARKFRLRKPIVDFIAQHHGTSLVYYFYRRALEGYQEPQELDEEEFRYPGPKPQTKEVAICLLADSAEAATRSIEEPTPSKIEDMVHKVINNRFIDGQLDECDLKLKDVETIAGVFTHILTGIYHARIAYPTDKHDAEHKEQSRPASDTKRNSKENRL